MRGDLVTVALPGDYGKPRPALVIQSDDVVGPSTTVLLLTSDITNAPFVRLWIDPKPSNGLRKTSQVMIDKAMTVRNEKVGPVFGRLGDQDMTRINRAIVLFFGLG